MANNSINLVDLDFFSLRSNLKNYLRNQPQFKDYDFEGSNISVLLDILSYNTFKNSFYINMLFSEGFLDSAQLRGSVVSHAKELNYMPRSAKSAKARVRVDFTALGDSQPYTIQKGQSFSTIVKNTNYTFTVPETITVSSANNSFSFETDIYEGIYVKDSYIYQETGNEIPRFRITNKNIDTDSLTVAVYTDGSSNAEVYTKVNTLLDLNSNSKVYFIQASETEYYEVLFGDNVLGKKPSNYSTIVLDYRLSNGPKAEGAIVFTPNFNPTGSQSELTSTVDVTTLAVAKGGLDVESIESIRYYAPRAFQVQERAVTANDYEISLKTQFPEINAIHAYGGEELNPPVYGKVYIAVDISDVDGFPNSKKREYTNFISKRTPFSIEPVFVEPNFLYLSVESLVKYNINVTTTSVETLKTLIKNVVLAFRDDNLDDFNVTYRNSKLICEIDEADTSIVSSVTTVNTYKKFVPDLNVQKSYTIEFNLALVDDIPEKEDVHKSSDTHALYSSPFTFNSQQCILEDNGSGIVRIMSTDGQLNKKILDVGTVDYDSGQVVLNDFLISGYNGDAIKVYGVPRNKDVSVSKDTILTIEPSEINISVEQVRL